MRHDSPNLLESRSNVSESSELHRAFIGLGSNIDPEINLVRAVRKLDEKTVLVKVSNVYQTPPIGGLGGDFLNATALVLTPLPAAELKEKILYAIENELGRIRTEDPNFPRTIDLDILIYDRTVLEEALWSLPHLCVPTSELIPDIKDPKSGRRLASEARQLIMKSPIKKYPLNLHWRSTP